MCMTVCASATSVITESTYSINYKKSIRLGKPNLTCYVKLSLKDIFKE